MNSFLSSLCNGLFFAVLLSLQSKVLYFITTNPYRRQGTLLIWFLIDILALFAYNEKQEGERIIPEQVLELSLQACAFSQATSPVKEGGLAT